MRVPQRLPVECARGSQAFKGVVVDIGAGGALLVAAERLAVSDSLVLSCILREGADVACMVQWSRELSSGDWMAGVVFTPSADSNETWAERLLSRLGVAHGGFVQRRRTFRLPTCMRGELQLPQGELPMSVTVHDLGLGGATVRGIASLPAGTAVFLTLVLGGGLPDLRVGARVLVSTRDRATRDAVHHLGFADLDAAQEQGLRDCMQVIMRGDIALPGASPGESRG